MKVISITNVAIGYGRRVYMNMLLSNMREMDSLAHNRLVQPGWLSQQLARRIHSTDKVSRKNDYGKCSTL